MHAVAGLPGRKTASIALAVLNKHAPGQFERGSKVTEIE